MPPQLKFICNGKQLVVVRDASRLEIHLMELSCCCCCRNLFRSLCFAQSARGRVKKKEAPAAAGSFYRYVDILHAKRMAAVYLNGVMNRPIGHRLRKTE